MQAHATPVLFYERTYYPFSNFSAFAVWYRGILHMTSEHAYQASKFLDISLQMEVIRARSAHDAKEIANAHRDKRRPDWHSVRRPIMKNVCRLKLEQHTVIRTLLLETGTRDIIEDSPIDSFWGWGHDRKGENQLGKIWMELRSELQTL